MSVYGVHNTAYKIQERHRTPMKKHIFLISTLIILVIVSVLAVSFMVFRYTHLWALSADYEGFEDDFNSVKNYLAEKYPNESDKCLSVSKKGIFDIDAETHLDLPNDVAESFQSIYKSAFVHKDSNFNTIRIHEGRISFCILNGQYALVYSPDEKPKWVNSPNEEEKVKVKSLGDGWYHVVADR